MTLYYCQQRGIFLFENLQNQSASKLIIYYTSMPEHTMNFDGKDSMVNYKNEEIDDNDEDFIHVLHCLSRLSEYCDSETRNDTKIPELKSFNSSNEAASTKKKGRHQEAFPHKLFKMLEDSDASGYSNILSWLPHGLAFKIHDENLFKHNVMKIYYKSTFESFKRQLYMYGFRKIGERFDDSGAYCHPRFICGRQDLCGEIVQINKDVAEVSFEDINFDQVPKNLKNLNKSLLVKRNKRKKMKYFH